jgi:tartrate-resistant acid phosphatase type 5
MAKIISRLSNFFAAIALLAACTTSHPSDLLTTKTPEPPAPRQATHNIPPTQLAQLEIASATPFQIPTSEPPIDPTATQTPTPTPTPEPPQAVRIAVIGDFGSGESPERDVADLVNSWMPDFVITVGDNNYPDGAADTIDQNIGQFYQQYIFPYQGQYGPGADQARFFPTLGNHDWNTDHAQPYLDYFNLPGNERYYDFTWGPVHIFALDSDSREPDGVSRRSVQAQWLQEQLAASTSPWKLVVAHHPPYSSGLHGSVDWMRWPFQEWGASALLSGHDHTYERLLIDGFPYFINGLGGGAIYYFVDVLNGSQKRYNDDYGAMLITADEQEISFEFFDRSGELIDTYQMQK